MPFLIHLLSDFVSFILITVPSSGCRCFSASTCWARRSASGEELKDRFAQAVARGVEGALFDLVREIRRDTDRPIDRGVQVLDHDRVLDGLARPFLGRKAVEMAAFLSKR